MLVCVGVSTRTIDRTRTCTHVCVCVGVCVCVCVCVCVGVSVCVCMDILDVVWLWLGQPVNGDGKACIHPLLSITCTDKPV